MTQVIVGGDFEKAIRIFQQKVGKSRVLKDLKMRERFIKRSELRRVKKRLGIRRQKRFQRLLNES